MRGLSAPLLLPLPERWFVALLGSDAVFEELATRGYVIERVAGFTGRRWLGAVASLLLSVAMHIPRGESLCAGLSPALVLALFTGLYLWRRSVAACALAHFLVDGQLVFGVPFLGQWLRKPHYPAMLLAGEGLIYCAVRWWQRGTQGVAALFPAASE
jgi:membrane protease YdiL (CAAX protease family)